MLLSEENDILRRWTEHFDELLNIECSNQNATSMEICQVYLDTDEPTPTLDEVENAIQRLKDNKAPGMDLIQAELIKKASPDIVECMYQLITKIWITETIPEDWKWSIVCPIHKKVDVAICSNYRGMSLLCVITRSSPPFCSTGSCPMWRQQLVTIKVVIVGNGLQQTRSSPYVKYLKNVVNTEGTHIASLLTLKLHMTA